MSDSAAPWTVAHQAPLSMEFSRCSYFLFWGSGSALGFNILLKRGTGFLSSQLLSGEDGREQRQVGGSLQESGTGAAGEDGDGGQVPDDRVGVITADVTLQERVLGRERKGP